MNALRSSLVGTRGLASSTEALVGWLLDGDRAVRWQVRQDLLDEPPDQVAAERARVESEGWGARLLAAQDPTSTWAGGLYSPKWISTTYTLLLLRQLGLPAGNAQAIAACARLLDGADWYGGGLSFARSVRQPETCITSLVVGIAASFRVDDDRVGRALGWLLDQQLPDGGWNCDSIRRGSMHGSFNTTILALEALEEWIRWRGADRAVRDASRRGREFFCTHRLYRSHRTGEVVNAAYTRIVSPPQWHHDLLRGLDHFQATAEPADERLAAAIDLLRSKRRADGAWTTNAGYSGRIWFELEPIGAPNRMNTLRALRVLRWWDRTQSMSALTC